MRLIGSVNAKTRKIGATSEAAFARERRGFFPRDRQRVQDAKRGRGPAEISEKHRMTPVHHSRNDQPINIAQNFLEALAFFRWMLGKTRTNSAWFIVRRDTQCLDIFTEISNPVGEFVKLPAKLFRGRVAERLSIFHCFSNFINAGVLYPI